MKFCKLRGEQVDKLVDSHIIPKAFFKYTKKMSDKIGWSGHMLMITNTKGQMPQRRLMIGWYDPNLVCSECERIFNEYDNYAIKLLIKNEKDHIPVIKDGQTIAWKIDKYDFKKLKLFFISLFWRAGASDMPQFRRIKSKSDIERAKKLILTNNIGKKYEFSFILTRFGDNAGKAFMLDPHPESRTDAYGDLHYYRFYLGAGYVVHLKIDKKQFPPQTHEIEATENKPLYILRRNDFQVSKEWEIFKPINEQSLDAMEKLKKGKLKIIRK